MHENATQIDSTHNQIDGEIQIMECEDCGEVFDIPQFSAVDHTAWENRKPAGMCSNREYKEQMEKLIHRE